MSSTVASPHWSGELPRWLAGVAVSWSLVAGVGLLASGGAVWTSRSVRTNEQQLLLGLADIGARSAARETASLLNELRRSVALLADDRADLLLALLQSPGDALIQRQLQADLLRVFPDHVAHSLVRPDGSLVIDDFGETVGGLCLADIAVFLAHGHPDVVMHPGPSRLHFDLMVPWETPQGMGVFFVSFRPDRLVRLLAQASGSDHRLWLLNRQLPALVEVTPEGARDALQGDHLLASETLNHLQQLGARVPVVGTRWDMVALPTADTVSSWSGHSQLRLSGALLTIWLFAGTVMWVLALHARRRQQLDQQRSLWSAVFNSAQEGIAITDARGRYLAVNESFTRITEYTQAEVLGKTPALLASGRHDEAFYRDMWRRLEETGQWQGEIWNRRKGGEVYLEWLSISTEFDDEGLPRHHIAVYVDFNRIRHAQTQLEHLAHHDALTDLPNRLLMRSRLQHALDQARRNQTQVAVLYMDLDRFKAVNDSHGHRAGDRVLREVARRLSTRLRGADTIARLGGDEFVVVLEEADAQPSALDVAQVIIDQVGQPIDIGNGLSITVGVSIGVGIFPLHATQMDRLLERADAAMYTASAWSWRRWLTAHNRRMTPSPVPHPFEALTPDTVQDALAQVGLWSDGRLTALNSYENRVYLTHLDEPVQSHQAVVLKFYRPARWKREQILEEHAFAAELAADEVPVVPPLVLDGTTLHEHRGFLFSVSPRRGGRRPELDDPEVLEWVGRFVGRIHSVGERRPFLHRPALTRQTFGDQPRDWLQAHEEAIPMDMRSRWDQALARALELLTEVAPELCSPPSELTTLRLHGDCHPGNVLWTPIDQPGGGPHFVDLDDARTGPAVQDLWMLLPGGDRREQTLALSALLDGYEQFRPFDRRELRLIEPLRTLRQIHYSVWLASRWSDPIFPVNFPWFGSRDYWAGQVHQLEEQIEAMQEPPLSV